MELAESEEGSDDGDQGIKSVVGADGHREFIMLPEWTVNNFTSTIKEVHFKTDRKSTRLNSSHSDSSRMPSSA